MTKKLLKNSLLLFLSGIIIVSCSLENEAVHQHEHSKKASYQRKMYDELILDKNFSKAIKQIPKKNVLASSSLNRTVMEEQYGFTIFDVPINVMETDSVISYNLCIQTDSLAKGDFFENLVINSNKFTNTIDAYLVKYNLLSEITPSAHGSFSFDFEPEIKPINYDASTARAFTWCYSYHYEMCHELVPGTQYESPHTPTEACNQQSLIYTHTETRCIVIGESGGTGDSGAFESSSSGTSGQSSDPYNNGQSSYGNNTIIINPNPLTGPTPSELKRIREQCFLNTFLSTAQSNWLKSPANAQTRNAIYDYLATQTNYGSGDDFACYPNDAMEFAQYALNVLIVNPVANPFLGADCRSFEFAQPPGASVKGCAVTNFNHTFYTVGVFPGGIPYYGEIDSTVPIAYFTMPSWMTNGRAANLTAKAVTAAIKATDLYYEANPTVSETTLGIFFKNSLTSYLAAVGGSVNTTSPPFPIPSPAPYITSIIGVSNPYDCE